MKDGIIPRAAPRYGFPSVVILIFVSLNTEVADDW